MAESTDAKDASSEQAAPSSSKASKLIVILALVNFLAVLGMGGYIFYTRQHVAAQPEKAKGEKKEERGAGAKGEHGVEAAEGEHAEEAEGEHEASAEGKAAGGPGKEREEEVASPHGDERAGNGPLLALEPMVTNMAGEDSDRYLKVGMQLRLTSEAARAEVEAQLVPVRNQILLYLSSLTIAETTGADNKREIQKKVKRIANESMPSSRITRVYFSEFVIQ